MKNSIDYKITQLNTILRNILSEYNLPISVQYYLIKDLYSDIQSSYIDKVNQIREAVITEEAEKSVSLGAAPDLPAVDDFD